LSGGALDARGGGDSGRSARPGDRIQLADLHRAVDASANTNPIVAAL